MDPVPEDLGDVTSREAVLDLNADLGEGHGVWRLGDDTALLDIVTSANVACGFHAGDPPTMRRVCELAVERGVAIGAQVSYHDLAGFGRRRIDVPADELRDEILYQIGALDAFARAAGSRVRYVKPHGALYNVAYHDPEHAQAVLDAVHRYDPTLPVLGQPGSVLLRSATVGITEAFADRAYLPDGRLVSRREPDAVLHDVDVVVERCLRLAKSGTITAVDGSVLTLSTRSLCIHGDTPDAVVLARRIRETLVAAGVRLEAFA